MGMKLKKKILLQKIILALLALTCGILVITLLGFTHPALRWSLVAVSAVIAGGIVIVDAEKYETVYKLFLTASVILALYVIIHITLHYTGVSEKLNSREAVEQFILSTGSWGIVIFFFLTLLQVVVLPIPAAVTIIAGAVIYGGWISFLVSTAGTIVGSVICFYLGRVFGKKLVMWLVGKEKTEKYATLLGKKGKTLFVGMMLFPFFPDDIICMVAGLTKMTFRYFIIAVTLARPVMIAFYSFLGDDGFLAYDFAGIMIRVGIFAAFIVVMLLFQFVYKKVSAKLEKRRKSKKRRISAAAKQPSAAFEASEEVAVAAVKKNKPVKKNNNKK